jgi:hypothetical protein
MASLLLPVLLYTTKPVRIRDAVIRWRMDPKDIEKVLVALLSPVTAGLIMVSYAARASAASTASCTASSTRTLRTWSARLRWRGKIEGLYRR